MSFYFFALLCAAAFFDRSGIMLWGMLAALLHECGHLAAMLLTGHMPKEINLTPFGVRIERSPLTEFGRGNLIILTAGSGVNFISSAVTFGFFPEFSAMSAVLGLINILPVKGLDGGGILLSVIGRYTGELTAAKTVKALSWLTLCGMGLTGIYVLRATESNFTLLGMTAALAVRLAISDRH